MGDEVAKDIVRSAGVQGSQVDGVISYAHEVVLTSRAYSAGLSASLCSRREQFETLTDVATEAELIEELQQREHAKLRTFFLD